MAKMEQFKYDKKLSKRQNVLLAMKQINAEFGEGTVYTLGSDKANLKIPRFSTGIEQLDDIIGGGLPKGRIIEIFGSESAGKTTLAYHIMAQCGMVLDVPIEGCSDCDTEYFNGYEWKKISDYIEGEKVLQYNADGTAELVEPLDYLVYNADYLWRVQTKNRLDMCISEFHNVVYKTTSKNPQLRIKPFHEIRLAIEKNADGFNGDIPKTFDYSGGGINLDDNTIRLMVAIFADGSFATNTTRCNVGLKKERKIKRLKKLLNACNIEYKQVRRKCRDMFNFYFYAPFNCKHYPKEWYNMNKHQFEVVIDEMQYWDGCSYEVGKMPSFCTVNKNDADFIQFAYTVLGYSAYIRERDRRDERQYIDGRLLSHKQIAYEVCSGIKSNKVSLRKAFVNPYKTKDGKMYCFTMPSSMWVMRRNNKIIVTGNSFDSSRAEIFGNHRGQLFVSRANVGEEALKEGWTFTKAGGDLVVIDSVPSMITRKEFEETDFEKESQRGRIAALLSSKLPKIVAKAEEMGTTWIFINQLRDEMNAMMFAPQTHTPGGRALKHYCSLRIQVNRVDWIKIPNKYDTSNSAKEKNVGLILKCKVVKSKVCNPLGECEIPLFFDRGFVSFDDIQPIRKELMQKERERYGTK